MFGPKLRLAYDDYDEQAVTLAPTRREWLAEAADRLSSLRVRMYTNGLYSVTPEAEEDWYQSAGKERDSVEWGIFVKGEDKPIGATGLHDVDQFGSCLSGIVIWEPKWWGKGIATRAHLIRTWFAANFLNRSTIRSMVRVENEASRKALEKVGYTVTGIEPRTVYRNGKYIDTYRLVWFNPNRMNILYPEGTPLEYEDAVERAGLALRRAQDLVQIL